MYIITDFVDYTKGKFSLEAGNLGIHEGFLFLVLISDNTAVWLCRSCCHGNTANKQNVRVISIHSWSHFRKKELIMSSAFVNSFSGRLKTNSLYSFDRVYVIISNWIIYSNQSGLILFCNIGYDLLCYSPKSIKMWNLLFYVCFVIYIILNYKFCNCEIWKNLNLFSWFRE